MYIILIVNKCFIIKVIKFIQNFNINIKISQFVNSNLEIYVTKLKKYVYKIILPSSDSILTNYFLIYSSYCSLHNKKKFVQIGSLNGEIIVQMHFFNFITQIFKSELPNCK